MYNDLEIQDTDSTACGFYCVAFILYLNKKNEYRKSIHGIYKFIWERSGKK